jgi:hypothetical protein
MSEECKDLSCCPPSIFGEAIIDSITYRNTEQSFTAECEPGFVCYNDPVTVTIPAGAIEFTPPPGMPPEGSIGGCNYTNFQEYVNCLAYNQAKKEAMSGLQHGLPPANFNNTEQVVECPDGFSGVSVTVPAGTFSGASQEAADAEAREYGESLLCCNEGDPTSCVLEIADSTSLGQVTIPQVSTTNDITFGDVAQWGRYKLRYVSGYYGYEVATPSPHPAYTGNGLQVTYNDDFSVLDLPTHPDSNTSSDIPTAFAGEESFEFEAGDDKSIKLKWTGWGGYSTTTNSNGSPNPTWELIRTAKMAPLPTALAILDWDEIKDILTPCAQCVDNDGRPEWDGTFPFRRFTGFNGIKWLSMTDAEWSGSAGTGIWGLNGSWEGRSQVRFSDSALPTETGCGWILEIYCIYEDEGDFYQTLIWQGVKGYGNTPGGKYCRHNGNVGSGLPCMGDGGPSYMEIGET